MKQEMRKGIIMAILAAVLYAVSSPFSKVLLNEMPPTLMAGFFIFRCRYWNELDCSFKKSETS